MAKHFRITQVCLLGLAAIVCLPLLPIVLLMHLVKLAHERGVEADENARNETERTEEFGTPRPVSPGIGVGTISCRS